MRIVSLCPSLTELVFDLGAGAELVGRTRFCVHPSELVGAVERLGGTKNPKIARIQELAPDVVLMNEEENRKEDAESLRSAGIEVHSSMPRTAEETAQMVESIGARIDRSKEAAAIATEIRSQDAHVRAIASARAPTTYAYLIWREPWMTISDDTFIAGLLQAAGGINVYGAEPQRYPVLTIAELAERRPDTILLSSEPYPFTSLHQEEIASLLGAHRARVQLVDGELLSWHGSRTVRGIPYALSVLDGA